MSQNKQHNQFTITHQSERQIRIITPSLFCNEERAAILKTVLLMREAIEKVEIDINKNAVTIDYKPALLPNQNLLLLLESVLKNFSLKPQKEIKKNAKQHDNKDNMEEALIFKIKGMSCNSCALFLEMILFRNPDIMHANIDFKSETGVVKGYLKQQEIIQIIEKNGYQAYCVDIAS